ncbi:iron-containing alcohol dehydrogenase family protein [Kalamiella sp. sgz302252]|uniref:iron-containing alcohol dehydrogenase family protein n=1 Tax=Pantoea sp. sgz302252 TaxID=3341827 RepID=UPI0036D2D5E5
MLAIKLPQHYLQQPDLLSRAGEYLSPLGRRPFFISTPRAWQAASPSLRASLKQAGLSGEPHWLKSYCTTQAVEQLRQAARDLRADLIVGIGGGRVLDTAKAVGDGEEGWPVVTIPTQAATCAAWSPVSIFYDEQGGHSRSAPLKKLPALVLADSSVIARSDVRYLKAGVVDALAKWFEFQPYQQRDPHRLSLNLKALMAHEALRVFENFGVQALEDCHQQKITPALTQVIDGCIALAGLANSVRDELPTPGFAHAIHNRLTRQPELHGWLHGEKVGFCLLIQSILQHGEADPTLLQLLRQFDAPLRLPELEEPRAQALRRIAQEVRFPADAAARLPFATDSTALEQALLAADRFF